MSASTGTSFKPKKSISNVLPKPDKVLTDIADYVGRDSFVI